MAARRRRARPSPRARPVCSGGPTCRHIHGISAGSARLARPALRAPRQGRPLRLKGGGGSARAGLGPGAFCIGGRGGGLAPPLPAAPTARAGAPFVRQARGPRRRGAAVRASAARKGGRRAACRRASGGPRAAPGSVCLGPQAAAPAACRLLALAPTVTTSARAPGCERPGMPFPSSGGDFEPPSRSPSPTGTSESVPIRWWTRMLVDRYESSLAFHRRSESSFHRRSESSFHRRSAGVIVPPPFRVIVPPPMFNAASRRLPGARRP